MKAKLLILPLTLFICIIAKAAPVVTCAGALASKRGPQDFIYPIDLDGINLRGKFKFNLQGRGTHNGHVSVFNLPRTAVESLLPERYKLANGIDSGKPVDLKYHPVIVVWGEISNSSASVFGIPLPSGLVYREWQLYIPGVYHEYSPRAIRTYVPRILVDASAPEFIGRRFYYKKILLDDGEMEFDIERGLKLGPFGKMDVKKRARQDDGYRDENPNWKNWEEMFADEKWKAILEYVPETDILGVDDPERPGRCSGFVWEPSNKSRIAESKVTMKLTEPLVKGMDSSLLNKEFTSVASYEMRDWYFHVDYYYNDCL